MRAQRQGAGAQREQAAAGAKQQGAVKQRARAGEE